MTWRLPVADVRLTDEDIGVVATSLEDGELAMGRHARAFEAAVAQWTGSPHAVAVASGTAALHLACQAIGLGRGDEVIVPALTFLATAHAPRYVGARPVLCDVRSAAEPVIDPADVERRLTPRTRAVIAVHWWGYPAAVGVLRELCEAHGLALIEDAAQAIGARLPDAEGQAGTVGCAGCLSLFSKKQLSVGEGGMVLTADDWVAERVRLLRAEGIIPDGDGFDIVEIGQDYRLDDPRAALGLSRLQRLATDIAARRAAVQAYRQQLADLDGLTLMWSDADVERASHFAFGVLFDTPELRDHVRDVLAEHSIQTTRYPALHALTEYSALASAGSLPHAETAADRHLVLPLFSHISADEVQWVTETVRLALQCASSGGSSRSRT